MTDQEKYWRECFRRDEEGITPRAEVIKFRWAVAVACTLVLAVAAIFGWVVEKLHQ